MVKRHRERHLLLHRHLDELMADMASETNMRPSKTTITELLEWSYKQTKKGVKTMPDETMSNESTKELGVNLTGVIKSIVRDVIYEQKETAKVEKRKYGSAAGSKWEKDEEQELLDEYSLAVGIIARLHGRGKGGIHARLEKLAEEGRLRY